MSRLFLCAVLMASWLCRAALQYDLLRHRRGQHRGAAEQHARLDQARSYLLGELKANAHGLDPSTTGDAAYIQSFPTVPTCSR